MNSGARLPEFKSWLCSLLAVWPWEDDLISLCLCFFTYKVGIIVPFSSKVAVHITCINYTKHLEQLPV